MWQVMVMNGDDYKKLNQVEDKAKLGLDCFRSYTYLLHELMVSLSLSLSLSLSVCMCVYVCIIISLISPITTGG